MPINVRLITPDANGWAYIKRTLANVVETVDAVQKKLLALDGKGKQKRQDFVMGFVDTYVAPATFLPDSTTCLVAPEVVPVTVVEYLGETPGTECWHTYDDSRGKYQCRYFGCTPIFPKSLVRLHRDYISGHWCLQPIHSVVAVTGILPDGASGGSLTHATGPYSLTLQDVDDNSGEWLDCESSPGVPIVLDGVWNQCAEIDAGRRVQAKLNNCGSCKWLIDVDCCPPP